MSDYEADSHKILHGLYFKTGRDRLHVECNWCDIDDYVFYDGGTGAEVHKDDWLAKAVIHLTAHHASRLTL